MSKKGVLVTGSHRSGSTWVGNMIALSEEIRYVDEPFNLKFKRSPFKYWFEYVSVHNERRFQSYVINENQLSPYIYWDVLNIQKREDIKPRLKKMKDQILGKRPLYKDPIALLSAEWIYKKFDTDVLILIRHPAAFVSSICMLGWKHDFSQFLKQPELMSAYLTPFREEIEEFARVDQSVFDQSILLWNIFHHVILEYKRKYPSWYFYRYEDIALSPLDNFLSIYKNLNLDFHRGISKQIEKFTSSENSEIVTNLIDPHTVRRDSKALSKIWKDRLTESEIDKIRIKTGPVADNFYSDVDWNF